MKKKKRLGIFTFYDKQGIVDDYVTYLLDSFEGIISEWVIAVNGKICNAGLTKLKGYSDKVYVRENYGFDAGAYKEVIVEYLGREYIQGFDELLIVNDTFYGPFFPWEKVWDKMSECNYAMWGITGHGTIPDKMDAHLQTYFVVFSEAVLASDILFSFFSNLEVHNSFRNTIIDFEVGLSKYIINVGFRWGAYIECDLKSSGSDCNSTYNLANMACEELIMDYDCPILKRKSLIGDRDQYYNLKAYKAIEYIDVNSQYDVNMIRSNIIRTFEYDDINLAFKYNFIIDAENYEGCLEKNVDKVKNVICILLDNIDIRDEFERRMPGNMATCEVFYIFDDYENRISRLAECYQYICILDERMDDTFYVSVFYRKRHWATWDNLLGDDRYISKIIKIFSDNEELGAISAPDSKKNVAAWFTAKTVMMLNEAGYWNAYITGDTTVSLENVLKKYGYFTGYVYEKAYSERKLSFLEYSLANRPNKKERIQISLDTVLKNVEYKRLYIYGFGGMASLITNILAEKGINIFGYIVTDSKTIKSEDSDKVQSIDEYIYTAGDVIIIGVGDMLVDSVENNLKEREIYEYYKLSL